MILRSLLLVYGVTYLYDMVGDVFEFVDILLVAVSILLLIFVQLVNKLLGCVLDIVQHLVNRDGWLCCFDLSIVAILE